MACIKWCVISVVMTFQQWVTICLTDTAVSLSMNDAIGNVIIGSINGTMTGGTSLVTGWAGNSIYMSDGTGRVKIGYQQSECLHNPDLCTQGVTFAIWIKRDAAAQTGFVLDSGASYQHSSGK